MQDATLIHDDADGALGYPAAFDGRGRFDHFDASRRNVYAAPVVRRIRDARPINDSLSLDREGFLLFRHATAYGHLRDPEELRRTYLHEFTAVVKELTGATWVLPRDEGLVVRTAVDPKPGDRSRSQVASVVHKDYTAGSAQALIGRLQGAPETFSRMAIIQTWRALTPPPQDFPLAVCDSTSVAAEDLQELDTVIGDPTLPGNIFESSTARPNPDHRWYYYPDMQPDELLLMKGYDSAYPDSMNVLHGAFDNRSHRPDAIARKSVEARYFAFFE